MGYGCNAGKVKGIIEIRGFQNKIAHVKSLFKCGTNKKFNILTTWNYLLIFTLLFFFRDIRLCHRCYPQMDPE